MDTRTYKLLSTGVIILLLASAISREGSGMKDAVQGAMVGAGAILAVVDLWLAGSKK
ncbi:hypothetical protein [Paenibacillus polymyxa]|uniref:hypothetical protein n=1 Tax=Paenibacillus polymyxa TaxID=1406 RepID=UPI0020243557|nr:hypothetical protein [Paenibacillus polymyxa]URJ60933.1 hypothetical protein MF622_000604 [Paenibacillus polymyxa]